MIHCKCAGKRSPEQAGAEMFDERAGEAVGLCKVPLTPKQEQFCREYLIDLNGTQAAIRAGYAKSGASVEAVRLLANAKISARVQELNSKRAQRTEITADRVLLEYGRLAFLDIRKAFDESGNLKAIHDLDDDTAAAIAGIEAEELFEGHGDERQRIGTLRKLKLSDKRAALADVARHLGMFTDRLQMGGLDGGPVSIEVRYVESERP